MYYRQQLLEKINDKSLVVGIIGLGYVGLPLALEYALKSIKTIGFDIDQKKIPILMRGESYIKHIEGSRVKKAIGNSRFEATNDFSRLTECDAIIICVPTPLDRHREPDLSFIQNSGKVVAQYLRAGQIVTLESSTYPGTTEEVLLPLFEQAISLQRSDDRKGVSTTLDVTMKEGDASTTLDMTMKESGVSTTLSSGDKELDPSSFRDEKSKVKQMKVGKDFFLAFSPEREDPNNPDFSTSTIPKVVGGVTPVCLEIACKLYDLVIVKTVPVSSARAAEATKLLENIYRSINIALVNELKMVFDRMDIDVWEVIEAAKTKPFGFQAFYPGPGLGGHCIPIDPFYLTWKAREYDISTKFIELAGEINTFQPYYVVEKLGEALNGKGKTINGSKVLILGAAYKKNIDDMRESPTLKLIDILENKGAEVKYSDPFVAKLPPTRKYQYEMESVELTAVSVKSFDVVLLSTDHDSFDYNLIAENAKLIIDTRNALEKHGLNGKNIFKA
ncbi:MAG: wbpA [Ignavibacteria bacterium]|nr:MAG: wbpA [Ignavibacteria bacterium]KAF0160369.1 MAG: wbpA [Ignavibacteria bacterium]